MRNLIEKYFKSLIVLSILFLTYYLIIHKNQYERITNFTYFYSTANSTSHIQVVQTNTTTPTIITTTDPNFSTPPQQSSSVLRLLNTRLIKDFFLYYLFFIFLFKNSIYLIIINMKIKMMMCISIYMMFMWK